MALSFHTLHMLRLTYGVIQDLPDGSPGFNRLVARVAQMDTHERWQVEQAGIRWLAPIARAIRTNAMHLPLKHSGGHVRDQGRGYL